MLKYWADISGAELPAALVHDARREALDVIETVGVLENRFLVRRPFE